ncbi:acetyltransferase [Tritrichomonas foetus]|uniref:Acetyltransferase n=1 Tax=Tritrichomonas foetus TaxID=1144522 RepID=A0A1J4JH79_9EUKA|nr:acetyltransferase [Tritrichomonas foetus]|eukprot:OHS98486.1 acetyltransferase [Tritrichomonas foetus]
MQIETERFLLRPIVESDANALFEVTSDSEVTRFMRFSKHEKVSDALDLIKDYHKNGDHAFSVIEKKSNEFVGVFCLKINQDDQSDLVLSVYFGRKFWNKGINSELMKYFVANCNKLFGNKSLSAYIVEANQASCHVIEKSGFKLVKTMKFDGWDGTLLLYKLNLV